MYTFTITPRQAIHAQLTRLLERSKCISFPYELPRRKKFTMNNCLLYTKISQPSLLVYLEKQLRILLYDKYLFSFATNP